MEKKMGNNFDDLFTAYAEKQEEEASARPRGEGNFTREYETIKWSALGEGKNNTPKVIRVMGGPPNSKLDAYTARTVTISWIVGDDGKKFKVVKPSLAEDPTYFLNKIINKVQAFTWVDKTKVYTVKIKDPDLFNVVDKNGLEESDPRYKMEKGWKGKEVLIMNVIDRTQMDWHRENKHSMLLAKSINIHPDGTEIADEGVSAYGVSSRLNHLFMSYGSWEKYDIAISKTGKMESPFIVLNASNSPMEVDKSIRGYISKEDSLTDEEKSWERYDLDKLFGYTTATKVFNRLKNSLKRIDTSLGTSFYEEVQELSEKEKKVWEEKYRDTKASTPTENIPHVAHDEEGVEEEVIKDTSNVATVTDKAFAPKRMMTARQKIEEKAESTLNHEPWRDLPHPEVLTEEQKKMVLEVIKDASGKVTNIRWDCPDENLVLCPDNNCGIPTPYECTGCPNCGMLFEEEEEVTF